MAMRSTSRLSNAWVSLVDPVQVLEDHDQRLVEALAHQYPLDRLQRPPPPDLRVHLRQRVVALDDAEQGETDMAGCLPAFGRAPTTAPADLLAPGALVIFRPRSRNSFRSKSITGS